MGGERKSMVMNDDEKKLTAYHEADMQLLEGSYLTMTQFTK